MTMITKGAKGWIKEAIIDVVITMGLLLLISFDCTFSHLAMILDFKCL